MKLAKPTRARDPHKLTRAVLERIVGAIRLGATWQVTARAAGVGESTLRGWRADFDDAPEGSMLAELREALAMAEAVGEVALVDIVNRAAPEDWRAAAWLLATRWPDRWARSRPVDTEAAPSREITYAEFWRDLARAKRAQYESGTHESAVARDSP